MKHPASSAHVSAIPSGGSGRVGQALLALLLCASGLCQAQSAVVPSCPEAAADEARRRFQAADAALHLSYGRVMEGLAIEGRVALRKEQRQWLAHRDARCQGALQSGPGGACAQRDFHACLEAITQQRRAAVQAGPGLP